MNESPTKSALPKIRPTGAPLAPPPPAKTVNAGIVSMQIELLVSVRDEPDKLGVGYCFFSRGIIAENALSMVLNRNQLIVSKALTKADAVTVTFLFGILLAECCALRRHESPLVARFQETLARPLYAPHPIARSQVFSDFAMRLARSPVLAGLKDLPLYGPSPRDDTHLLNTITLEIRAAEAQAPWKRLSKAKKKKGSDIEQSTQK